MRNTLLTTAGGCLCCLLILSFFYKNDTKMKPALFNHMALHVKDLEVSYGFYKDILGLEEIEEPFKQGRHKWFRVGEHSQLHIIGGNSRQLNHIKDTHLAFSVADLNEFIGRLEDEKIEYANWQGTSKTPTVRPDGVKQIYLQYTDGYWLEVNNDR
jgi:lactoylglutathione lyase